MPRSVLTGQKIASGRAICPYGTIAVNLKSFEHIISLAGDKRRQFVKQSDSIPGPNTNPEL